MNILEKGSLRQRVRAGEVKPHEALGALLTLRHSGEVVRDSIIEWLQKRLGRTAPEQITTDKNGKRPAGRGNRFENG